MKVTGDGASRADYVTAGAAALSGLGAIDAGVRQDLTGDRKLTYVVSKNEVIAACDERGAAMVFTSRRHFRH